MLILDYIQTTLHFACILAQQHWVFLEGETAIKMNSFLIGSFFYPSPSFA
jgi:hypothetical protein